MRWVLIRPGPHSTWYDPEIQEPLGLECLAAWRRSAGDEVLVLDGALDALPARRMGRRAAAFRPDAVGLSLTTAHDAAEACAIQAECLSAPGGRSARWVAGGNFISTEPEQAARLLPASFALVRFEGERALDAWSAAGPQAEGGPETPRMLSGEPMADLDALPFPERPYADQVLGNGWAMNLQGSRGCCGRCRYCASPGMAAAAEGRWRGRSPAGVVEEMAQLERRHGAAAFNFVDEDFLGPARLAPARAAAFAEALERRRMRVSFGIQVRPETLSDAVIDRLAACGLGYVFLGVESDDREDFRRWGRPWTADPWRLVDRLRGHGIEVNAGALLFHPDATLAGIRRFAGRLRDHGLLDHRAATNRLDAMPGSVFHAQAMAGGLFPAEATGPQPLPFRHAGVAALHRDVLDALAPLGPPAMHAVCALPALATRRPGPAASDARRRLKSLIAGFQEAVAETLFALLDGHATGGAPAGMAGELFRRNHARALEGARALAAQGFAPSFEALAAAIEIDAGVRA